MCVRVYTHTHTNMYIYIYIYIHIYDWGLTRSMDILIYIRISYTRTCWRRMRVNLCMYQYIHISICPGLIRHAPVHVYVFEGALQLLVNRYGKIRFAQVPERGSTKSFVVLIIGHSKSNHFGAQGTFNPTYAYLCLYI